MTVHGVYQQADHDRPYVYLTTIEQVAALYLCNAVERPYYWFQYGFESNHEHIHPSGIG
jgi:hypothetical protein